MRSELIPAMRALALCALVVLVASTSLVFAQNPQYPTTQPKEDPKAKDAGPKISDGEAKAIDKINASPTITEKVTAATEFVKKYPKSTMREKVAVHLAGEAAKVTDTAQQITAMEGILAVFDQPKETAVIYPALIDAYVKAQRPEDALTASNKYLEKNPGDVGVLTQMALVSTDQLKRQKSNFIQPAQQFSTKAIELIEADKKPETIEPEKWSEYKTKWLPHLYQSLGIVSYLTQNKADAKVKLEKAVELKSTDPVTYMLLGGMADEEYQEAAKKYQAMSPGPLKDETLKDAHAKLDVAIELYAQSVALASNQPGYEALHNQLKQNLEAYYKYRHNGSTNGMEELINKYKKP
jgi:tetratricopeptide (TPR) repeat protein